MWACQQYYPACQPHVVCAPSCCQPPQQQVGSGGGAAAAATTTTTTAPAAAAVAEAYYDSDDADAFYRLVWGGQDIHVGCYEGTTVIRDASDATVDRMAGMLPPLAAGARVLDIGAGYGGSMRRVLGRAAAAGVLATCLNISDVQNATNRARNREQGFSDRIDVVHGSFEEIPEADGTFDVVWSQDAILHSDRREVVLQEVWRVLKAGGTFIFTDPMQADGADGAQLGAVYERLRLPSLGSPGFYRRAAEAIGFETVAQHDLTSNLRTHYARVREELLGRYAELRAAGATAAYLDKMAAGLESWVRAADAGNLYWGISVFRKPS